MSSPDVSASVEFSHFIGDRVTLKAIDHPAQVIALMLDAEGPAYRVVYWWEGARRAEWVFGWEIA